MKLDYYEMLELCDSKKELSHKIERVGGQEVDIFTYHVQMSDTFDSELAKWFRGTVFDADSKKCIARPFPKFFNLNEQEESKDYNVSWDNALFFPKMDGYLLMPVLLEDGDIHWKSKSTFHSDHAHKATMLFRQMSESERTAIVGILEAGWTPLFELISNDPEFRIVVEYDEEKIVYLGRVEIETGIFIPGMEFIDVKKEDVADMEDIEGFVIYDGSKMVKMKTAWYLPRHRAVWNTTKKSVVQATLDDTIDDVIGIVAGLGMEALLSDIEGWRDDTIREYLILEDAVEKSYALLKTTFLPEGYTRKEFAEKVINDPSLSAYRKFFFALEDEKDIEKMKRDYVFNIMICNDKKGVNK